jgi:hypothetical protein
VNGDLESWDRDFLAVYSACWEKSVIVYTVRETVGVEESTRRKRVIVDAVREAMNCRVEQPAAPEQARSDEHCVNSAH